MKSLIRNLFCLLFILNCVAAEEFSVTTVIKNSDSSCTKSENDGCSCTENDSMQKRLKTLETLFQKNRVTLCGAGMQDFRIKNDQLSSSDFYNNVNDDHSHIHARLYNSATGAQAWCAVIADDEKWIQVDFNEIVTLSGVVTQGRGSYNQWVTLFTVQYRSSTSEDFKLVQQTPFPGNVDRNTPTATSFPAPVQGRFFRIKILEWFVHPSMRFDFLLC